MDSPLIIFLSVSTGLAIGVVTMVIISKAGSSKNRQKASMLSRETETKAGSTVEQTVLDGRTQAYELEITVEEEIKERRQGAADTENKLPRRKDNPNFRNETLISKEEQIDVKSTQLADKTAMLDRKDKELREEIDVQVEELGRVVFLTTAEAREELMAITEKRMEKETMTYIEEKEEEAKSIVDERACNIVALSIQRVSSDEAVDRIASVVSLLNEEVKGKIIGRGGRNVKAIEQATDVDPIVDDIPETITVSCLDPIRREVVRLALEHLIRDGRIQPGCIEGVVHKIGREIDTDAMKTGGDTVFKLGIGRVDREVIHLIGRLRYRSSYGQNILQHSMGATHLTGVMAAELGLNQRLAKRVDFLRDIGKALDFEVEGSHIELGYRFCKKHGEREVVLDAIQSHHREVEPQFLISNLAIVADMISVARPGACYEAPQNYINRLDELERITKSLDGVDSAYAIQVRREVHVMVVPGKTGDLGRHKLTRDIKDKIEARLAYPGQIRVAVIHETKACELAKQHEYSASRRYCRLHWKRVCAGTATAVEGVI